MVIFGTVLIILACLMFVSYKIWEKRQERLAELRRQQQKEEREQRKRRKEAEAKSAIVVSGETPSKVRRGRASVVLLVDDSPTMLLNLRKILERWNYKVITAKDGREAWGELQKLKPDLLISDIEMPNLNGVELVKLMRSDLTLMDIPVVLITGSADQYLKAGQMIEIEGLLQKPFDDKILIDQIRYILQE